MPVDHARLVAGLAAVAGMVEDGQAPAALEVLVSTARLVTGAGGATYTEFGEFGGRVVQATGSMVWSLGQPIPVDLIDEQLPAEPVLRQVELLPALLAEPLLGRGLVSLAASGVRAGDQARGAVHLFFGEASPQPWPEIQNALRVVAYAAQRLYPETTGLPASPHALSEQEDRALFLAVAGHELRTPVTVLKGYAGMLAARWSSLDEVDRREAAGVLSQRADELARLVDRLLGASIGDGSSGSLLQSVVYDPVEALLRAVRELPAELRRAVHMEVPTSLPLASGDPGVLASVVAELVTNAVRYSSVVPRCADDQLGSVGLSATVPVAPVEIKAAADSQTLMIRVCDRGVGIDPTQVERAFERFWRARRDGDARGGVGLGLYLVRRLVERQNGWVSLRPRKGGGTVAEVRLPRADGALHRRPPGEA